jgi:putative hemolysin
LDEPPGFILLNIVSDQKLLYFFSAVFLLFISAWSSAVEAAFFSVKTDDIDRLKNSRDEREQVAAKLLTEPRLLLSILTTCKYSVLLGAAILLTLPVWIGRSDNNLSYVSGILILTAVFSIFGVILPKIYGTTHYLIMVKRNSKVCRRLALLLMPVVRPLQTMSIKVEKKLAASTEQKSVEEFSQALQLATVDNDPVEGEKAILEGIVNFGTLTVRQVMRPRSEISYTDMSLDFHQLMEFIKKSGYSRVPVCSGSLDTVRGLLYIKDLLPFLGEGPAFAWQKLLRAGYFVQENKKIDFLLKDFQEKRVHMALVLNQQGNTSGLITLEDIIEEIIGDINDEFDEVGARYQKINDKTFVFDGKTSIHEFCKVLHFDPAIFQPVKGINESLNGLLLEVNEGLPAVGDKIAIGSFTFVIESVDQKRIKKIRVQINGNVQP